MPTQYTSLLGFALPVTGELSGTWGDVVNDSITQLVEDSVAGFATASVTSGNWTLTTTGSGASNQARMMILRPTGTPGVSRDIIAPSKSKIYVVQNYSDAAVVLKGAATTGTTIPAGAEALCAWDGTDFITISDVSGPSSSTNNAIATYNGTTGKLIQNTGVTVDGSNNVTIPGQGDLRWADADSSNWVAFQAPSTVASNVTWTLPNADGSNGAFLSTNGSGTLSWGSVSLNTPLVVVGNSTAGAEIRLPEDTDNGTNYVAWKAPDSLAANITWTLPSADGSNNQVLTTNGSGILSWSTPANYPGAGIAVSTGSAWGTSLTAPSGAIVGTTDTQTLTNKTFQGYMEKVNTIGNIATSTYNVDLSLGNIQDLTLGTNVTITFTNPSASGFSRPITLIVRQPSSSPGKTLTVTGAKYTDGTAPILSTGANQVDVLTFWSIDGGTTYFGTYAMANVS